MKRRLGCACAACRGVIYHALVRLVFVVASGAVLLLGAAACSGLDFSSPTATPLALHAGAATPASTRTAGPGAIAGTLQTGSSTGRPAGGPWLIFEERPDDFGRIDRGKPHEYSYDFKNAGDATLKITDVRIEPLEPGGPTGGVKAAVTLATLEPSRRAELVITFDNRAAGMKGARLRIISNDSTQPEMVLPLKFDVIE